MSTALVPFDAQEIERSADPGTFVVLACERAKEWLVQALEQGDIESIAELKSQAEAIRVYTTQKQLGKDAELSAQEIVRRAERGLGIAVKRGQEQGAIAHRPGPAEIRPDGRNCSPAEIFNSHRERTESYIAAEASDEQFEAALEEAKAEENLTRANVVRKVARERIVNAPDVGSLDRTAAGRERRRERIRDLCNQGARSDQIAAEVGISEEHVRKIAKELGVKTAEQVIGSTRRIDPNRVVNETVNALDAAVISLKFIQVDDLDRSQVEQWATSLSNSLRSLNRLAKQLKEMTRD